MSAVLDSFPTLRPTDSLPARMRRVWSSTYQSRFPILFCWGHPDDESALQFDHRTADRAQASALLRYARAAGAVTQRGRKDKRTDFSVFLDPNSMPAALRALPAGRK